MAVVDVETDYANDVLLYADYFGPKHRVRIPENTIDLRSDAFMYCHSVVEVEFPASLRVINERAFFNCDSLVGINFPEKSSLVGIGSLTFSQCHKLKSVRLPRKVTTISERTFEGCFELTEVMLPQDLITIENNAFEDCTSLSTLRLPKGVTKIGANAFGYCSDLTSIKCLAKQFPMVRDAILNFVKPIHDDFIVETEGTVTTLSGDPISVVFRIPLVHIRSDDGNFNMFNPELQIRDTLVENGAIDENGKFDIYSSERNELLRDQYDTLLITQGGYVPNFDDLYIYHHDDDDVSDDVYHPTLTPIPEE